MHADESFTALRARYVFPVLGPPIEWGVVTLHGEKIIAVGKASDVAVTDLGNVAIVPGLVNAHTHLEFSDLEYPLGEMYDSFSSWVPKVIAHRRARREEVESAIRSGLSQSCQAGVTSIGDIVTSWPDEFAAEVPLVRFHEVICLDRARFDDVLAATAEKIETRQEWDTVVDGISPHAPYTVHPELIGPLLQLASDKSCPVAMHLAESPEEMALFKTGKGPLRGLLEELGVWRDDANPEGLRPLDYMRVLSDAPRSLVVHGNYLDHEEIEFLARHSKRMAVVFCPRTHAYFFNPLYPLHSFWSEGATVCIGTDSRASNIDLSLHEELKFIAAHYSVPPSAILQMGTINGANMLFGGRVCGAIEPNRRADLAIIELPEREAADPHELLFSDEARVVQTWYGGRPV